jgi:ubiquinone biosynthesis protein UbiJ
MGRTLREYFLAGPGPHEHPALKGVTGTYRFDVEGQGSVRVEVRDGAYTIAESSAPADCMIRVDESDLARIASGEQNMITALLQGRVQIQGDYALAQKFHGLVRGRQAA